MKRSFRERYPRELGMLTLLIGLLVFTTLATITESPALAEVATFIKEKVMT